MTADGRNPGAWGHKVTLEWYEMLQASFVGAVRHLEALSKKSSDAYGADPANGWSLHIEGACGEMAFCKACDLFWPGTVNTYRAGFDAGNFQIRTRSRDEYDLIVRASDADDKRYVLVTGLAPTYTIWGSLLGGEAKKHPEWLREHGGRAPAFFVPKTALEPLPRARRRWSMNNDGLKKCPRCAGKGWTYYKGFKCSLCKGSGRVRRSIFLCEGVTRTHMLIKPWRYRTVIRQCRRPACDHIGGKHYCWQHSPKDGFARRVKWGRGRVGKAKPLPAPPDAAARWRKQQAEIKAATRRGR